MCLKRPQDIFKIASRWPTWANLDPSWAHVGSKLPQVGAKLAPCCLKLGPSWLQNRLQEDQGGCSRGSQKGPGSLLGVTRGQEALQEAPEVPKWPPHGSKIDEKSIKLISDLRALASEWSEWSGILDLGSEGFSSSEIWDLRALASESSKWSGILDLGSEWSSTDGGFSPHLYV